MRIVFLTHNFPRFDGDLSGAFLANLAQALTRRGVDVRVVAPSDEGEVGPPMHQGVPVRRVRYATPRQETLAYRGTMAQAIRSPSGWLALARLRKAMRRAASEEIARGADLIHAHWWVPAGLAAPPGAPMLLTVHGTDVALLRRSRLGRLAARPVFQRARVVTAVSSALADIVAATVGRSIGPAGVVPMPLDTSRYLAREDGGGGAVVVARLTPQKRISNALRALAHLAREGRRLRLTVVGDGPERAGLERLARELGVAEQVRFTGAIPPAEVPGILGGMDLMLFPAEAEGFGLGAAEALMCGVPVVACRDGGGVLDIVPPTGGGRIAEPTPWALAAAAESLLIDPTARADARRLGEAWRARLAPDAVASRFEALYREALSAA